MLGLACLAFFLSGMAALIFQVVWQRLFGVFSGSDVQSATIVVAAFMAGLGVGSLAGGRLADRMRACASLLWFVAAELAVTWVPTGRTRHSFIKVFPHVLDFGAIALGSNEPIRFDPDSVRARLSDQRVQRYYAAAGVDILALLAPYLDRTPAVVGPEFDRSTLGDLSTDLFPRDEFSGIRHLAAALLSAATPTAPEGRRPNGE